MTNGVRKIYLWFGSVEKWCVVGGAMRNVFFYGSGVRWKGVVGITMENVRWDSPGFAYRQSKLFGGKKYFRPLAEYFEKKIRRSKNFPVTYPGTPKKGSGGQFFVPGSPGTSLHTMSPLCFPYIHLLSSFLNKTKELNLKIFTNKSFRKPATHLTGHVWRSSRGNSKTW